MLFKNRGGIIILKKMLNYLSFLGLLYVSGDFKQKKFQNFFLTDRKILTCFHVVYLPILKLFTAYRTDQLSIGFTENRMVKLIST